MEITFLSFGCGDLNGLIKRHGFTSCHTASQNSYFLRPNPFCRENIFIKVVKGIASIFICSKAVYEK